MNDKQMKEQPSLWSAADLSAQCLAKVYSPKRTDTHDDVTYKTTADLVVESESMCSVELVDAACAIQESGYEVAEMGGSVYWKMWRRGGDLSL